MSILRLFVISLFVVFGSSPLANVTCTCVSPPGGLCTCEDGQYAICKVRDGRCVAVCRAASQGNPRTVATSLVAAILDTTPNAIGYDINQGQFDPWVSQSPLPDLLTQLSDVLGNGPKPDGYALTFSDADREFWRGRINSDPGITLRFGLSETLRFQIKEGLPALRSSFGRGR